MTDIFQKVAKTHKGRLHLEKFEPKAKENPRNIMYLRSTKISDTVRNVIDLLVGLLDVSEQAILRNLLQEV